MTLFLIGVGTGLTWFFRETGKSGLPELNVGRTAEPIANWFLVGPLPTNQDSPLSAKCINGKSDAEVTGSDLLTMSSDLAARMPGFGRQIVRAEEFLRLSDYHAADSRIAATRNAEPAKDEVLSEGKVYYAACTLRSLRASTKYLMLASDAPVRIYLNGKLVGERTEARMFRKWDNGYPLHLKRGRNLLLVKMVEEQGGAGSIALRLEPDVVAATRTALDHGGFLVSPLIVAAGQRATMQVKGAPSHDTLTGELFDSTGARLRRFDEAGNRAIELVSAASPRPSGLCRIRLRLGEQDYNNYVCFGEPDSVAAGLFARLQLLRVNEQTADDIDALRWRWRVLTEPKNRSPKDREWQAKVVFILGELQEIVTALAETKEPVSGVAGLHIRAIRSEVDGQVEHYRAFVPQPNSGVAPPMPLFVMLPTPVQVARPFIESVFIARHLEAEEHARLADQFGAALLWSGYRSNPNGTPLELSHLDSAIAEMCRTYAIDRSRIYLLGSCAGSVFAMQAALEWPHRFAAVGLLNPAFRLPQVHPDNWAVIDIPQYADWRKANDPVTRYIRSKPMPLRVVHDGDVELGHGELEESVSFVREAEAGGLKAEFVQSPPPPATHFHVDGWAKVMSGLLAHRNERHDPAPDEPKGVAGGPIWRAFQGSFVVVRGTGGSEQEKARIDESVTAFQKSWLELNHADCRVVADTALAASQLTGMNLVLVGNADTNSVWNRLGGQMGVTLKNDEVVIGRDRVEGDNLSVQAIVRNPANPKRRIVLLGAADASGMSFGTLELSECGWFDYAVWRKTSDRPALVAAANHSTPVNPENPSHVASGSR